MRRDGSTGQRGFVNFTDDFENGSHFVTFHMADEERKYFAKFCVEQCSEVANQFASKVKNLKSDCYLSFHPNHCLWESI